MTDGVRPAAPAAATTGGTATGGPGGPGGPGGGEPGAAYGRTPWRRPAVDRGGAATPGQRKEHEVRGLLDLAHPAAPPDLAERAMARGRRLLRLRRARTVLLWLLLIAALVAAGAGVAAYTHAQQPPMVTPPVSGP